MCVLRWRLVYPSLRPAASFSSLAVTAGQCVGYNQMEEWSEHNKYDWYSPAQAWPDSHQGFGRPREREIHIRFISLDMRFMHWKERVMNTVFCVASFLLVVSWAESETRNTQHQSVVNPNYPWCSWYLLWWSSCPCPLSMLSLAVAMCPDNVCCDQDMLSRDHLTQLQMLHTIRDVTNKQTCRA